MSDWYAMDKLTRRELYLKLDAAEQALDGQKARVDIAERRSIAAGEQAEELQEQVIDLTAALRKAKGRIEKLRLGLTWYADYTITEQHPEHKEFNMGYRAQKALTADDAASK